MKQEDIFNSGEADAWFTRNKDAILTKTREQDITYQYLQKLIPEIKAKNIIEIGCSNGFRLNWFAEDFGLDCFGLEPSKRAVDDGQKRYHSTDKLNLVSANMDQNFWETSFTQLFKENSVDVILFGFCFYLMSPELYFLITSKIDKILKENGVVVIFDFDSVPQRRLYQHYKEEEVWSHKMDFSQLFTCHPMYKLIYKEYNNHEKGPSIGDQHQDCSLSVIRKLSKKTAFVQLY